LGKHFKQDFVLFSGEDGPPEERGSERGRTKKDAIVVESEDEDIGSGTTDDCEKDELGDSYQETDSDNLLNSPLRKKQRQKVEHRQNNAATARKICFPAERYVN